MTKIERFIKWVSISSANPGGISEPYKTLSDVGPDIINMIDAATELVVVFCGRVDRGEVLHTEEIRLMRAVAILEVDEVDDETT